MTKLLEQAIAEISKLSPEEQDIVAQRLLDELAEEEAFDRKIAETAHKLAPLARKAQEDLRAGRTFEMDLDS
jgi:hypothetical protein